MEWEGSEWRNDMRASEWASENVIFWLLASESREVKSCVNWPYCSVPLGEEALTMYMAKNKLDRKMVNATQGVEALHQLASSYFIDRDGTMRKLHEIQISSNAIKVRKKERRKGKT